MIHKSTVKASVRHLTRHALDKPGEGDPGKPTTKTLKFRIDAKGHTRTRLDQIFTAQNHFRRDLYIKLEGMWDKDPESFISMVNSSPSKPFQKKTSCSGWIETKFVTGVALPEHLSRETAAATAVAVGNSLTATFERRKNVISQLAKNIEENRSVWRGNLKELCSELKITPFKAPPSIHPAKINAKTVEKYNEWVAAARIWCNLILVQKHRVPRNSACLPVRLKHYPGFPGSVIFKKGASLATAIKEFRKCLAGLKRSQLKLFDGLTAEEWGLVIDRFPAPEGEGGKGMRHQLGKTLAVLGKKHPDWKPRQLVEELVAGLERGADSLVNHLKDRDFSDRPAAIKLINLLNNACVVLMEPLRVKNLYRELFEVGTPRRDAFGQARGALAEPTDQSEGLEIRGFSIRTNRPPIGHSSFNGFLAVRQTEGKDEWSFFFDPDGPGGMGLSGLPPAGSIPTDYIGFGSTGGSRKKAQASEKKLVRERLWIRRDRNPLQLPLQFGKRQGREYLWNFDHGLKKSSDPWMLANGRLLRVYPPNQPQFSDYFLTITLQKDTPPLALSAGEMLIGVDQGEVNPASYAVTDAKGKLLTRGNVGESYSAKIRQFAEMKSAEQRTAGGYTRKLRSKERNTASACGGLVIRELLDLLVRYPGALVFERLSSGIATRGGRGTLMSNMHYQRITGGIEKKLSEAGCHRITDFKSNFSPFLRMVQPHYTSATCSNCGEVFDSDWYEKLTATIRKSVSGSWVVTLPDGKELWLQGREEIPWNPTDRLEEIFKGRTFPDLTSRSQKIVQGIVGRLVAFRPKRGEFVCPCCGHTDDADLQAALNIARKSIWLSTLPKRSKKETLAEARGSTKPAWKKWYQNRISENWC